MLSHVGISRNEKIGYLQTVGAETAVLSPFAIGSWLYKKSCQESPARPLPKSRQGKESPDSFKNSQWFSDSLTIDRPVSRDSAVNKKSNVHHRLVRTQRAGDDKHCSFFAGSRPVFNSKPDGVCRAPLGSYMESSANANTFLPFFCHRLIFRENQKKMLDMPSQQL
ncbi:MAG: hypothetical protein GTO53_14060 [Planctomycetales bacterium]|nr:hypothetical protein [Planctomycetales bacterium]NIM10212.1 hypothetical protein [Planctomycetales bacterium]NIO35929.1 hypothetical protein [Planctomycetales bacterium]NIP71262.1 hypothetical protein [Planctomycetales bacterium]